MGTVRTQKDNRYFTVSNEPFNDKRLSWEARGMMGYLLSKPNDWTVQMSDLENQTEAGIYKVRAIFKELEEAGYVKRTKYRNEKGLFEWETVVYENTNMRSAADLQPSINPSIMDATTDEKPRDILNTELLNTESLTPQAAKQPEKKVIPKNGRKRGDYVDLMLKTQEKAGGPDLSFLYEHLYDLGLAFSEAAGEAHYPRRSEHSKWIKIISEWYELGFNPEKIHRAVRKMREEGLTIGGPESVTKIARDLDASVQFSRTNNHYQDVF